MTNPETATPMPSTGDVLPAAYIVRGNCGREWRIPAAAVLADYKECISEMDGLDDAEMDAHAKKHFDQEQWWNEQCQAWEFVDTYGSETDDSAPRFKTKAALARNRGRGIVLVRVELVRVESPALTQRAEIPPEVERRIRASINPAYVHTQGTESQERAVLLGEIDRLRALVNAQK